MPVLQVKYITSLVHTVGKPGWADLVPTIGALNLDQPISFAINISPSKANTGYSTVYLALLQTYEPDSAAQTLMGAVEISYFNFGPTSINFTRLVPNGDGTANVSASVAVDFISPAGVRLPMSGAITSDASNVSTACAVGAPSSTAEGTSYYTCEASVPIKVKALCCSLCAFENLIYTDVCHVV